MEQRGLNIRKMIMGSLGSAAKTAEIIKKYGFTIQKRYGQNFLTDEHVLGKIIDAAAVGKDDGVIEIGPGLGTMTRRLSACAKKVVAIEIDKDLIPILKDTLSDCENVQVINDDVMKIDMVELIKKEFPQMNVHLVANLPYYITTPVIMSLLENHPGIDSITVMVQKEVAQRMQAGPGSKDYGALSLAVQYHALTYIAANVPQNCFIPRPKVGSCVIRLSILKEPPVSVKDEAHMFALIRAAFNQRRKMLTNAVSGYPGLDHTKNEIEQALEQMHLPATIRGETLNLQQFATLSNILT